jgi:hypothetical protein
MNNYTMREFKAEDFKIKVNTIHGIVSLANQDELASKMRSTVMNHAFITEADPTGALVSSFNFAVQASLFPTEKNVAERMADYMNENYYPQFYIFDTDEYIGREAKSTSNNVREELIETLVDTYGLSYKGVQQLLEILPDAAETKAKSNSMILVVETILKSVKDK